MYTAKSIKKTVKMKPSLCIFQAEASQWRGISIHKIQFCLFFYNWNQQNWCQKFTELDLMPLWPSSCLWEASNRSVTFIYFIFIFFHTGTNESERSLNRTAFIYLCETNEEKQISTFFPPDLAVTREFGRSDFSLVHQSACFVNVLQWTVFVSPLGKGEWRGGGGGQFSKALTSVCQSAHCEVGCDKISLWKCGEDESPCCPLYILAPPERIHSQSEGSEEESPGLGLCDVKARLDHGTLLMQTLHEAAQGPTLRWWRPQGGSAM